MPNRSKHVSELAPPVVGPQMLLLLPLLILALATPTCAEALFSAPFLSFDTGPDPRWVLVADLNADGRPDLATANLGTYPEYFGTVSVLLGNGDGTFGARTDYAAGIQPRALEAADLNGDGWLDLLAANHESNTVSVLLGSGDGTFGVRTDYGTRGSPQWIAIGDFNGDGLPDVVTANGGGGPISVLLGNGDGTLRPTADPSTDCNSYSVSVGDLNGDGRLDLAAVTDCGKIQVLPGNGDGTFGPWNDVSIGGSPRSVAIADLNGDGWLDLATSGGVTSVLLGNGDGTFGGRSDLAALSTEWVAIAHLDGDGQLDLTTSGGGPISVILGNGDGTFRARNEYGPGADAMAIGDLNSDGRMDLAVVTGPSTVSVLLNRTAPPQPLPMVVDLTPGTLNLTSRGRWVTGYLEANSPLSASDLAIGSIRLNGIVPVDPLAPTSMGDYDGDGVPDRMVKFDRVAVELNVSAGDDVPILVTGTVAGQPFSGTDYLCVRRGVMTAPSAGHHLAAGSVTDVLWQTPGGHIVESVELRCSLDGGITWSEICRGLSNTGSYPWATPALQTDQARIAVLAESNDQTGDPVRSVLALSERFSLQALVGVGDRGRSSTALAIRSATPNPSTDGRLRVEFALGAETPARLELIDVAGRVLAVNEVGRLGPGTHALDLSPSVTLKSGIYFLRLTQGAHEALARAAVLQ